MSQKPLVPLLLSLAKRRVVIFGGGEVGWRKASLFSRYCHVDVVSRSFVPELKALESTNPNVHPVRVERLDRLAIDRYVKGAYLVVAATDDEGVNAEVADAAHAHGALVNSVDHVEDVVVPSIIELDGAVIAISTRGTSPAVSKFMRLKLEQAIGSLIPFELSLMIRLQHELREHLKTTVPDQHERAEMLWGVLESDDVWEGLSQSYEQGFKRALAYIEGRVRAGDA